MVAADPSPVRKPIQETPKNNPIPQNKDEPIDQKKLEAQFEDAWSSRFELLQTILEHDPAKGEELPDDIFDKIAKVNENKENLKTLLPKIERLVKTNPEVAETRDTVKRAVDGDTQILEIVNDYLGYTDQDALKYDLTRVLQHKFEYDLAEYVEIPQNHMEAINSEPDMTYQDFKKIKDNPKPEVKETPSPITTPKTNPQKAPTRPQSNVREIEVVKEDSFEYEVSDVEQ